MKLKYQINAILNLKIFLIIFTFALSNKTFSNEKNWPIPIKTFNFLVDPIFFPFLRIDKLLEKKCGFGNNP